MLKKLWKDEAGLVAMEYLFAATILVIGVTVGLVAVKNSVVAELTELGNAVTALSQEYSFSGVSWMACASTEGSQATDSPELNTTASTPATTSVVDTAACP